MTVAVLLLDLSWTLETADNTEPFIICEVDLNENFKNVTEIQVLSHHYVNWQQRYK